MDTSDESQPDETQPDETQVVAEVVHRLTRKFPGTDAAEVRATVNSSYHEFDDAPIRSFVPILVERSAAEILRPRAVPA